MSRTTLLFLAFLISLQVAGQGVRDSLRHLPTVEIKAARPVKKEEAGMRQSRVDSFAIVNKANVSLSELLSENTPVFIKNHGRGALATASFRGTAASHTQVTWNGLNINSPMTGTVDFSLIPVYLLDEVSLKHGAASLADGAGGLGGSVSLANKPDWTNRFSARYIQGIGSYGTWDEYGEAGYGNRKFRAKTRIYHNRSANDYTFINKSIAHIDPVSGDLEHPLDTNRDAGYLRYGGMQEVYYMPGAKNTVSVKYWGQYAERAIPRATSYEGSDQVNLSRQTDTDHKIAGEWNYYPHTAKWQFRMGFSRKELAFSAHNQVYGSGIMPVVNSLSHANSLFAEGNFSRELPHSVSLQLKAQTQVNSVKTIEEVAKTGYDRTRNELGLLAGVSKTFGDNFNLNAVMRLARYDAETSPLIPYLGFDWKPFGPSFTVKGNIARNFHYPSLNDLYWQPGGNPELLPEEGITMETGVEYGWESPAFTSATSLTLFRSDIDNWILWLYSFKGFWEPFNISRVLSYGLEATESVQGTFGDLRVRMLANYAFTRSLNYGDPLVWSDNSYGRQLVYVPVHSGNLMAAFDYKRFTLSWQHNSYSERFTTSSNDITRRDWLYPYYMNDLSVKYALPLPKVRLDLELKIYNLFDESYRTILYRPMPGRNYMAIIMVRL